MGCLGPRAAFPQQVDDKMRKAVPEPALLLFTRALLDMIDLHHLLRETSKTQRPATLAPQAHESVFRPPGLNVKPGIEPARAPPPCDRVDSRESPASSSSKVAHAPWRGLGGGVGAARRDCAQYQLVHGAAFRCSGEDTPRVGAQPTGAGLCCPPLPPLSPARAVPRRLLRLLLARLGWLFVAHVVAMATSFAPPGPRALLPSPVLLGKSKSRALPWTSLQRSRHRSQQRRNSEFSASELQMPRFGCFASSFCWLSSEGYFWHQPSLLIWNFSTEFSMVLASGKNEFKRRLSVFPF